MVRSFYLIFDSIDKAVPCGIGIFRPLATRRNQATHIDHVGVAFGLIVSAKVVHIIDGTDNGGKVFTLI